MKVADKIVLLAEKRTTLSSKEIAAELFVPEKGYAQRVDEDLRNLVGEGQIERFGAGGSRQPYRYRIKAAADASH
jgi:predicted transcriptional regulator